MKITVRIKIKTNSTRTTDLSMKNVIKNPQNPIMTTKCWYKLQNVNKKTETPLIKI